MINDHFIAHKVEPISKKERKTSAKLFKYLQRLFIRVIYTSGIYTFTTLSKSSELVWLI